MTALFYLSGLNLDGLLRSAGNRKIGERRPAALHSPEYTSEFRIKCRREGIISISGVFQTAETTPVLTSGTLPMLLPLTPGSDLYVCLSHTRLHNPIIALGPAD